MSERCTREIFNIHMHSIRCAKFPNVYILKYEHLDVGINTVEIPELWGMMKHIYFLKLESLDKITFINRITADFSF